jgi:type II secretory pathway component GspD/PulD (secretin)
VLNESARAVRIEVAIVEFTAPPPDAEAAAPPPAQGLEQWLDALHSENRLVASTVVALSTLDGEQVTTQFGARAPLPIGRTRMGRGGADTTVSYNLQELGTIVTAIPRVAADGAILLHLRIERSTIAPQKEGDGAAAQADGAGELVPPTVTRFSTESSLRLQNGQPMTAYRKGSSFPPGSAQMQIVVTAHADEAPAAPAGGGQVRLPLLPPETAIRTYRLNNAAAPQAAAVLARLMNQRLASVGVDEESNSIIVRGTPAELERVESILERLDGAPVREPEPPVPNRQ